MVQINSSTAFVVAVIAANALAAPTHDETTLARRAQLGPKSKAAQQKINDAVRFQETKLKGQERNTRKDRLQAQDQLAADILRGDFNAAAKDNTRVQNDNNSIKNLRNQETQIAAYARPITKRAVTGASRAAQQKINDAVRIQEGKLKGQERNTRKDKFQAQGRLADDILRGDFNAAAKDNARVQSDIGNIRNLRKQESQVASYARPLVKRAPAPGDKSRAAQQKINSAVRVQEAKLKTQEQNARKDSFRAQNAQINDLIRGDFKAAQADGARVQKDQDSIKDLRAKEAQIASYARPVRRELDNFGHLEARSFDDFELEERDVNDFEMNMLD